ncbi:retrovirus-related pol polyprotein from transposon TNT 1-94 [Tanacetum coccineum]
MILESVENGPLIWPTIEENGVTRTKKYAELSVVEKIHDDCDIKATHIILQGFVVPIFSPRDDLIACLNKAMDFLTVVASSSNATSSGGNNASGQARVVKCYNCQAEAQKAGQILDEEQLVFLADPGVPDGQSVQTIIPNNTAFQTEDLDTYYSDCDDISNAKAVLMDNISNYGSDIISEVVQIVLCAAPRALVLADSLVSTSIDQDAPSTSIPSTQELEHSLNISQGFEKTPKTPMFRDDLLHEDLTSQGSSSNVRQTHTLFEHLGNGTYGSSIANVIGDPSHSVSTRKQLQTDAMWCYFDAFLTSVEPKNFKQAYESEPFMMNLVVVLMNKGRLVVKDSERRGNQFRGIIYSVARILDIRIFRSKCAHIVYDVYQMEDNPSHVYKLKKALYGFKQAPRAWYDMLSSFLISQHFSKGVVDLNPLYTAAGTTYYCWSSKKQKCIAISSTKAEYIALSGCCAQILWMRSQLTDCGFQFNKIHLYCHNKSMIALCCNNVQHSRAKHIDVRYYFIKEQGENGIVELYFVRTEYQLADIFTKPLPRERFNFLIEKLGELYMLMQANYTLVVNTGELYMLTIMSSITAQQTKLDLELVPKEKILEIGKCNGRLNPRKI